MPLRPGDSRSESAPSTNDNLVRLQKVLARAGHGSRRACEDLIRTGRVRVDGQAVSTLGARVDSSRQKVSVDGEVIRTEATRLYMLNKPRGYLCTNKDPRGRPRVIDLFPAGGPRLFPVGRLDENSEGLLLVTNDGDLANRLIHPKYQVPRIYEVQVAGIPTRDTLQALRRGMHFSDGFFRVQAARKLKTRGKSTFLQLELRQGRNREIRRLLARVGHKVMHLERIAFGPLRLGRLKVGEHRVLRPSEMDALKELVDGQASRPSGRRQSGPRSGKVGHRRRRGSRRTGKPKRRR